MNAKNLQDHLNSMDLKQLRVIAKSLEITYSGKPKKELIDEVMQGDQDRLRRILGPLRHDPDSKELILSYIAPWSWKKRLGIFLGVFGSIWLLLEPLSAFTTGTHILSWLGWWGYFILVFISLVSVPVCEFRYDKRQLESLEHVLFRLVFPRSGHQILIRAPRDLQIESFLREFAAKVGNLLPVDCAAMHLRVHNLMIKTEGGYKPVDSNLTLQEAGITDGTICRLRDYIRVEYSRPLLDIEYSWQPVRLELARAGGFVILDEKDSISFEDARAQGLLSESAIARVERFLHQHGGTAFVVLCPENEILDIPELATRGEVP